MEICLRKTEFGHYGHTAQKMKFSIKDFFNKCDQIQDLVTLTEEILNGKLHFVCNDIPEQG